MNLSTVCFIIFAQLLAHIEFKSGIDKECLHSAPKSFRRNILCIETQADKIIFSMKGHILYEVHTNYMINP